MNRQKIVHPGWTWTGAVELPLHVHLQYQAREVRFTAILGAGHGKWPLLYGQMPEPGVILVRYAQGWTPELYRRLLQLWRRWHLNRARATCPHQREQGWDYVAAVPGYRLTDVGQWVGGYYSANRLVMVPQELGGFLGAKCPECGHRCGDLYAEDVPQEVVDEIFGFPEGEEILPERWFQEAAG